MRNLTHETKKKSKNKTVKIGEGGYGCVFKPSLTCDKYKPPGFYRGKITKVTTNEDANEELERQARIDVVDPNLRYHLRLPTTCNPSLKPTSQVELLESCEMINPMGKLLPSNKISLLMFQNGGIDLDKFVNYIILTKDTSKKLTNADYKLPGVNSVYSTHFYQKNESKRKREIITKFWKRSDVLIDALNDFIKNKIIHADLKPGNIVYNHIKQRFNIIDFGLSVMFADYRIETEHFSYPPETFFLNPTVYKEITLLTNEEIKGILGIEPFDTNMKFMNTYDFFITQILPINSESIITDEAIKHRPKKYGFYDKDKILKLFDVSIYKSHTIEEIKNRTRMTHDIYGMGLSLLYVLVHTYKLLEIDDKNDEFIKQMYKLLLSMVHPDFTKRQTIDGLKEKYNKIISLLYCPSVILRSRRKKSKIQKGRHKHSRPQTQKQQ